MLSSALGCHALFPLGSVEPQTRDEGVRADGPPLDSPRAELPTPGGDPQADTRPLDQQSVEGQRDAGWPVDAAVLRDNGTPADGAPDNLAPVDLPLPDLAGAEDAPPVTLDSTPVGTACAAGVEEYRLYTDPRMVMCLSLGLVFDQCAADSACGTGWHLCTATEYLARGGADTADHHQAWIASCIRDGSDTLTAPTNGICTGDCQQSNGLNIDVSWPCGGGAATAKINRQRLGLTTYAYCRGVGDPVSEAYWLPHLAEATLYAAVCCWP